MNNLVAPLFARVVPEQHHAPRRVEAPPIRLSITAAGGASGVESFPILFDQVLVSMRFRCYLGQQLSLQVRPQVRRGDELMDLLNYPAGGPYYVAGDDETIDYRLNFRCWAGQDSIYLAWTNVDPTNTYNATFDFEEVTV